MGVSTQFSGKTSSSPSSRVSPVLMVMHRKESEAGAVGSWLREHGIPADVRRPRFGDPLPETLERHSGAIIFGGPMSANDADAYIKTEIDWIGVPLSEKKPFLGICLGAQMLAKHLGGKVAPRTDARVEAGYVPIHAAQTAAGVSRPLPSHAYQWHREGFALPAGTHVLANGEVFENQAFAVGNAVGVQFHPEITQAMIHRWTVRAARRLADPGAQPPRAHVNGHLVHGQTVRIWLGTLLSSLLLNGVLSL